MIKSCDIYGRPFVTENLSDFIIPNDYNSIRDSLSLKLFDKKLGTWFPTIYIRSYQSFQLLNFIFPVFRRRLKQVLSSMKMTIQ